MPGPFQYIRLFRLFLCNSTGSVCKIATDRQYQEQMFDQVYDILIDSLDIQVAANISSPELKAQVR